METCGESGPGAAWQGPTLALEEENAGLASLRPFKSGILQANSERLKGVWDSVPALQSSTQVALEQEGFV